MTHEIVKMKTKPTLDVQLFRDETFQIFHFNELPKFWMLVSDLFIDNDLQLVMHQHLTRTVKNTSVKCLIIICILTFSFLVMSKLVAFLIHVMFVDKNLKYKYF